MNQPSRIAPSPQSLEQRREDRIPVRIPGILRLPEIRGGMYMITILDVSKVGLRISSPKAVPNGTRVEVKFNDATVFGAVKYARDVGDVVYLGIEADKVDTRRGGMQTADLDLTALCASGSPRDLR